eukprot:scaffold13667_cov68-Phaeocystis_antarctica.AAC.11
MARLPIPAARMRAVVSMAPRRSTLAPRCSSSFATRSCPPYAAACNSPRPFSPGASTCPPCFSHSTTACSSPRFAAAPTPGGSDIPRRVRSGSTIATLAGNFAACCRSSLAIVVWPLFSASWDAVSPSRSRSSVLAPACSSSCTHSVWPSQVAPIRAVDARLVLEQQAHHGVLALRRSRHESGAVIDATQVDAGTALQQLLRHMQAPSSSGRVQQPAPVLV